MNPAVEITVTITRGTLAEADWMIVRKILRDRADQIIPTIVDTAKIFVPARAVDDVRITGSVRAELK